MKQVILSLLLVISLITEIRAEEDPKKNQMIQGGASLAGAAISSAVAIGFWTACSAGAVPLCVMAGAATTAAAGQLGLSVYSFTTAESLSSDKEINSKDLDFFNSERPLPTDENFNHLDPNDEPTASSLLRDDVLKNMNKIKAQIEDLKDRGIITDEIFTNPEKFLTPEQLAAFNADKEKLMAKLEEENGGSQEALEALLEESKTAGSQTEGSETAGFQTASLTSGFGSLNLLEGLLGLKEKGIQNSAPGYYGNVSLKSLRPDSSMSLFERVSLKIRREMKKQSDPSLRSG